MHHYFVIYKPYNVLSQFTSQLGKQTLANFFDVPRDVYPVGRLDNDSEGLLILTNDASLNHQLLNPTYAHERAYWVQVDGAIDVQAIQQLQHGVEISIDGKPYQTKTCTVTAFDTDPIVPERIPAVRFRKQIPAPWIQIILTEGKNRQVRKMTAKVGYPTLRLIRQRIEQLELGNMQPGDMISISKNTIYKKLFGK